MLKELEILNYEGVLEVALPLISESSTQRFKAMHNTVPVGTISINKIYLNTLIYNALPKEYRTDKKFLYLANGLEKERDAYMSRITNHLFDYYRLDRNTANWTLGAIEDSITKFVRTFDMKLTESLSLGDFTRLARSCPEMRKMLTSPIFDATMSLYEINDIKQEKTKLIREYIMEHKFEPFYSLLGAGAGLRIPQLADTLFSRGIRPDYHFPSKDDGKFMKNEIIPFCIKDSWLNGTQDSMTYWIENSIARNALVVTKLKVSEPSVLGKQMSLSSARNYISETDECCSSIAVRPMFIKDDKALYRVHGRNMVDAMGRIIPVTKFDRHLIGQTINLRSPAFCNSDSGICHACAGWMFVEDFKKNVCDGRRNLGAIISKAVSAPAGQNYLSLKHAQTPMPKYINFSAIDSLTGEISKETVKLVNINGIDFSAFNPIRIFFEKYHSEEKEVFSDKIYIESRDKGLFSIELDESNFYVSSDLVLEDGTISNVSELRFITKNTSVQQLYQILVSSLGGKQKDIPVIETINELDFNLESEHSIAAEIIFRGLIYDIDTNGRADFSNPNIRIGTRPLEQSIKEGDALVPKLFLGNLKEIVTQVENFDAKNLRHSIYDELLEYRS